MTDRSIFFVAILVVVASPLCLSLKGSEDAVCREVERQPIRRHLIYPRRMFGHHHSPFSPFYDDYDNYYGNLREQMMPPFKLVEKCCIGYTDINGTCEPQCTSECENGYCSKPNKCACNDGYEETSSNKCIPICDKICINGNCTGPNNCTCDQGYEMNADGFTCEPVCSSGCEHGWCSEPGVCKCHIGYEKNNDNKCEPICTSGCENGKCVDPDTCSCNHGFQSPPGNNTVCVPRCKHPCEHGTCTAPNKCTCNHGYQPSQYANICTPKCQLPCDNGWCSAPDICECNDGYIRTNDGKCLPVCKRTCENGTCVAPNICECTVGFEKSKDDAFVCQPRCSRPCTSGKCTAPETCTCDANHRLGADKYTCEPVCDMACENGYCAEPNVCGCHNGYQKNATNKCDPICEMPCVNGKCVGPDSCACNVGFRLSEDIFTCEPICDPPCGFGAICTAPGNCTCMDSFVRDEAKIGRCVSTCKTSCNHGFCTSDGCSCFHGWGGESCDTSLFCIVTQPVNSTEPQTNLVDSNRTNMMDENYWLILELPTCSAKCIEQLNSTAVNSVNSTITIGNETLYLVTFDSLCNTVGADLSPSRMSSGMMGAVIGITLFAVAAIFGVVIFIRIKRRPRIDGYTQRLVNESVEVERTLS